MVRSSSWFSLALDSWSLGLDASAVIGMRAIKLAAGGSAATAEAQRMVEEKIAAAVDLQMLAMTGGLGPTLHGAAARSVRHYAGKVRANRRRLARPKR